MSVSAIIVTRGDVDLKPILDSLPEDWERVVWENGHSVRVSYRNGTRSGVVTRPPDLSVYGRYAAIQYASHDCIYVQDDDCIVSDPQAIVDAWKLGGHFTMEGKRGRYPREEILVANMPPEFLPHYPDSCLVGFGACFHRDLPARAFRRFMPMDPTGGWVGGGYGQHLDSIMFRRTSDVVFTTLTPRVLVDVPVAVLPYASDANRMWKQPDHFGERTRVLEMTRKVRDASVQ